MNESTNDLIGICPVCSGPSGADVGSSNAYESRAMTGSDKNVPLVWSQRYETHVCQSCKVDGEDMDVADAKRDNDVAAEEERARMGFVHTYTPNEMP